MVNVGLIKGNVRLDTPAATPTMPPTIERKRFSPAVGACDQ
jgi:hypothetical protein